MSLRSSCHLLYRDRQAEVGQREPTAALLPSLDDERAAVSVLCSAANENDASQREIAEKRIHEPQHRVRLDRTFHTGIVPPGRSELVRRPREIR